MKDSITTDRLIDWLNRTRPLNPSQHLADLLKESFCDEDQEFNALIPAAQLIDLVCIDLIEQRRLGNSVDVESLIEQFPSLQNDEYVLDLIDADICVLTETNSSQAGKTQANQYIDRFPHLAEQINELIGMNISVGGQFVVPPSLQNSSVQADSQSDFQQAFVGSAQNSQELSVDKNQSIQGQSQLLSATGQVETPIATPDWFLRGQVVAGGQDTAGKQTYWLIRGRDAARRTAIAMKIIKLPATLHSAQADCILDACEKAAKVRNPVWVAPSVAAIQNQHLAVIRPWEFGTSWQAAEDAKQLATRFRQLATIAYALQAAHRLGAAHGCVHANNIIVRHDGSVRLVDAQSSSTGTSLWSDQGFQDSGCVWRSDTQGLIKLIDADVIDLPAKCCTGLQDAVQKLTERESHEACGAIGDELLRRSDALANADDSMLQIGTDAKSRKISDVQ